MSEHRIEHVGPTLAVPVAREPLRAGSEHAGGVEPQYETLEYECWAHFADDDAE